MFAAVVNTTPFVYNDDKTRPSRRLTVEEIAGLMMYSSHQMVPFVSGMPFRATYDGKPFEESGAQAWALTDQQKKFLTEDHLCHVLVMLLKDARTAAHCNTGPIPPPRPGSIGQGDFRETADPNRSYRGKACYPANESDLDLVLNTRKAMKDKPVIVSVRMLNPCVLGELDLEPYVDSQGNAYDFAFGLNWSGVICDDRTRRYPKDL